MRCEKWRHGDSVHIHGNSARVGGGIDSNAVVQSGLAITATVNSSSFSDNTASNDGGAIANATYAGTSSVNNSTFFGNSAGFEGGAIDGYGSLTVTNSTLFQNSFQSGGGIATSGALTLTNCTLSQNSATDTGGIYNDGAVLTLQNTIVAGNVATNDLGDDGLHINLAGSMNNLIDDAGSV